MIPNCFSKFTIRRFLGIYLVTLLALFSIGCSSDGNVSIDANDTTVTDGSDNDNGNDSDSDNSDSDAVEPGSRDIVSTAQSHGSLGTLVTAIARADLTDTLSDESRDFTLFAVEDDAFAAWGDVTSTDEDELRSLVLYHVLDSNISQATATATSSLDELAFSENGQALSFSLDSTGTWNVNGVAVTTSDIEASNGTIHILSEVLIPDENPEKLWTSFGVEESVDHEDVPSALFSEAGIPAFMRFFYAKSLGDSATSEAGLGQISGGWQAVTGDVYPYQLWVPDTLEAAMPFTLILHTRGEQGDNNTSQLSHAMATTWAESMEQATILMAPQAPQGSDAWSAADLNSLIDTVINTYDIDPDRLYINGHSFGGRGVLNMLASTERSFAAAALFAPSGQEYDLDVEQISKTPQWYAVSESDRIVDDEAVLAFYRELLAQ